MYASCLYCNRSLGRNDAVEALPVGRSLAFDSARARLWVICTHCQRWNLSPFDERELAIAQCERLFRTSPLRASTDQIGLAKLREGLQLVRIGEPTRPEMATWRYGRVFAQRRRNAYLAATAIGGLGIAIVSLNHLNPALYSAIPALGTLPSLTNVWHVYRQFIKPIARVRADDGSETVIRGGHVSDSFVRPDRDTGGWCLDVAHRHGRVVLHGQDAERALGRMLAFTNRVGGKETVVTAAAQQLMDAGSASAYLRRVAARNRDRGGVPLDQQKAPVELRLAMEMALHEDTERVALEGDFASLRDAWREAEALAVIADQLLVPSWAQDRLDRVRAERA